MTPILKALALGYAAPQVLDFVQKAFPSLSNRVKKAKSAGYTAEQILGILNQGMGGSSGDLTEAQIHQQRDAQQGQMTKDLLKLAAGSAASYGASRFLPSLLAKSPPPPPPQVSQGRIAQPTLSPSSIGPGPIGPQPMANAPVSPPPIPATAPPNVAQAAGAVPQAPVQPAINSAKILQEMGLESRIENLLKAGNDPATIGKVLEHQLTPGQKKWLGEGIKAGQAKSIQEMVAEYVANRQQAPQSAPSAPPSPEKIIPEADRIDQMAKEWEEIEKGYKEPESKYGFDFWEEFISKDTKNPPKSTKDKIRKVNYELDRLEKLYERADKHNNESLKMDAVQQHQDLERYLKHLQDKDIEEMAEKPKKGSIVATPDGIVGSVKDIKEKEALIESDGKVHKVKKEDLEPPSEDLIQAAQNLLKIPEVDRSSVISLVTYRPSAKQMFIQYHNGETYVYEDVAEEKVKEISEALGVPVTTGKNIYGAWEEGKRDSRGAALIHGIIRDPKYGKDQEGKTWEKLGTPYDYWKKLRKPSKKKKK